MEELGIKYELENVLSPSQDLLSEIKNVFIEKGRRLHELLPVFKIEVKCLA